MIKRKNKLLLIASTFVAVAVIAMLVAFSVSGYVYWMGPFKGLGIEKIKWNYSIDRTNEIIYYGASNFARWWNMEEDMAEYGYIVQNHAFGGSCDKDLIEYADYLVYPYNPKAIFIQTGSNDYVENVEFKDVIANKEKLYSGLSQNCPNAVIIVMGGLPLPGRSQYQNNIDDINAFCRNYCETHDKFIYVDSNSAILGIDGKPKKEYFESDGIHLNQIGHDAWTPLMIKALEAMGIEKDII